MINLKRNLDCQWKSKKLWCPCSLNVAYTVPRWEEWTKERVSEKMRQLLSASHSTSAPLIRASFIAWSLFVSSRAVLAHRIDLKRSKGAVMPCTLSDKSLSWPLILSISLYNGSLAADFQLLIKHSLHSVLFWAWWFLTQTGWFWPSTCFVNIDNRTLSNIIQWVKLIALCTDTWNGQWFGF